MGSLINFQFGDFFQSTPSWFDWFGLIVNAFLVIVGFAVAFSVYYTERCHNAKDSYEAFQDSLQLLDAAITDTIKHLETLKTNLADPNDSNEQPILSVNLNDRFIQKIDLSSLKRYYKCNHKDKLDEYNKFMKYLSYIGTFHDFFIHEYSVNRERFKSSEEKFQLYRTLVINKHKLVEARAYEPLSENFRNRYLEYKQNLYLGQTPVIDANGNMLNRTRLNKEFVRPLAEAAYAAIGTDSQAADVFNIATDVNAHREDMEALKASMATFVQNSLKVFKEDIQPSVKELYIPKEAV